MKRKSLEMMLPNTFFEDMEEGDNLSVSSQSMSEFGTSNTSAPSTTDKTASCNSEGQSEIARNDTRRTVRGSKALVLIVILAATAACGIATYIFTSRGEEAAFEAQVSQSESFCCIIEGNIIPK
jgi:hypothetical protein